MPSSLVSAQQEQYECEMLDMYRIMAYADDVDNKLDVLDSLLPPTNNEISFSLIRFGCIYIIITHTQDFIPACPENAAIYIPILVSRLVTYFTHILKTEADRRLKKSSIEEFIMSILSVH